MVKAIKIIVLAVFLVLAVSSCSRNQEVQRSLEEIRTGTDGILISFLPNIPPGAIHAESNNLNFDVVVEVKNKGAYPEINSPNLKVDGKLYLSGHDKKIITFSPENKDLKDNDLSLEGKSPVNVNGGSGLVTFKGTVNIANLNVDKYEPTLLATACYKYFTTAGPAVCIDPDPYSTTSLKKVCEVQDISLSSQGAPVAITRIDEEAFGEKTQFKITIKNVGKGEIIKSDSIEKCNPFGATKITREDLDKVKLDEVKIGDNLLNCWPFVDGDSIKAAAGIVRLVNGEGSVICELGNTQYSGGQSGSAYNTPIKVSLSYAYRTTAEKKLQIKKETASK